jgi:hypothetical protein
MKQIPEIPVKTDKKGVLMHCIFLFVFFLASTNQIIAQASDEPSLKNLKKNTVALREEILAQHRRDEILSYVYMVVGIIILFCIAWFSTNAKKRNTTKDEVSPSHAPSVHKSSVHKPSVHKVHKTSRHPQRRR